MESLLSKLGVDTSLMCLILGFFVSKDWDRIPPEKRKVLEPKSQECISVRYSEFYKGYKLTNMITQISFIERSVQFEAEPTLTR